MRMHQLLTAAVLTATLALAGCTDDKANALYEPLLKYIDEQFHIENDYVFFLDYTKYNTVPTFVVPKCEEFLRREGII